MRKQIRHHLRPFTRCDPTSGTRVLVTACEITQSKRLDRLRLSVVSAGAYLTSWQSPDEKETCGRAAAFFSMQTMRTSSFQTTNRTDYNILYKQTIEHTGFSSQHHHFIVRRLWVWIPFCSLSACAGFLQALKQVCVCPLDGLVSSPGLSPSDCRDKGHI